MPSFGEMRPQPPLNPLADAYGAECLRRSAEVARSTRCLIDISYGSHSDQKLDIYLPGDAGLRSMPVMVFFHGGGFTHGYKEWCGLMAPPLTAHPGILVSPAYRLMSEARYPESIEDAVSALRWVHENIAQHGGSPDRIFVGGHSAGALLAALLALDVGRLRDGGVDPSVVKAACCISGTYTRDGMAGQQGYDVSAGPLKIESRSPLALAHNAHAPWLFTWGGRERQRQRVERSTLQLMNAIRDAGQPVDWYFDPQGNHFSTHTDTGDVDSIWAGIVRRWFERLPTGVMGDPA